MDQGRSIDGYACSRGGRRRRGRWHRAGIAVRESAPLWRWKTVRGALLPCTGSGSMSRHDLRAPWQRYLCWSMAGLTP